MRKKLVLVAWCLGLVFGMGLIGCPGPSPNSEKENQKERQWHSILSASSTFPKVWEGWNERQRRAFAVWLVRRSRAGKLPSSARASVRWLAQREDQNTRFLGMQCLVALHEGRGWYVLMREWERLHRSDLRELRRRVSSPEFAWRREAPWIEKTLRRLEAKETMKALKLDGWRLGRLFSILWGNEQLRTRIQALRVHTDPEVRLSAWMAVLLGTRLPAFRVEMLEADGQTLSHLLSGPSSRRTVVAASLVLFRLGALASKKKRKAKMNPGFWRLHAKQIKASLQWGMAHSDPRLRWMLLRALPFAPMLIMNLAPTLKTFCTPRHGELRGLLPSVFLTHWGLFSPQAQSAAWKCMVGNLRGRSEQVRIRTLRAFETSLAMGFWGRLSKEQQQQLSSLLARQFLDKSERISQEGKRVIQRLLRLWKPTRRMWLGRKPLLLQKKEQQKQMARQRLLVGIARALPKGATKRLSSFLHVLEGQRRLRLGGVLFLLLPRWSKMTTEQRHQLLNVLQKQKLRGLAAFPFLQRLLRTPIMALAPPSRIPAGTILEKGELLDARVKERRKVLAIVRGWGTRASGMTPLLLLQWRAYTMRWVELERQRVKKTPTQEALLMLMRDVALTLGSLRMEPQRVFPAFRRAIRTQRGEVRFAAYLGLIAWGQEGLRMTSSEIPSMFEIFENRLQHQERWVEPHYLRLLREGQPAIYREWPRMIGLNERWFRLEESAWAKRLVPLPLRWKKDWLEAAEPRTGQHFIDASERLPALSEDLRSLLAPWWMVQCGWWIEACSGLLVTKVALKKRQARWTKAADVLRKALNFRREQPRLVATMMLAPLWAGASVQSSSSSLKTFLKEWKELRHRNAPAAWWRRKMVGAELSIRVQRGPQTAERLLLWRLMRALLYWKGDTNGLHWASALKAVPSHSRVRRLVAATFAVRWLWMEELLGSKKIPIAPSQTAWVQLREREEAMKAKRMKATSRPTSRLGRTSRPSTTTARNNEPKRTSAKATGNKEPLLAGLRLSQVRLQQVVYLRWLRAYLVTHPNFRKYLKSHPHFQGLLAALNAR